LCSNPKTRETWADVKAQAAAVGIARSAYLPTLSATWQSVREKSTTHVDSTPKAISEMSATVRTESLTWNWLLYDFGAREANLKNANALFNAARATQNATLQAIFAATAKDYTATQAAMGALLAAQEVERMTYESMIAAQARVDRGIAPITDALQAQTQHEEAVYSLTKAQSDAQSALGTLAIDMNLSPDVPLEVPPVTDTTLPGRDFNESISELIRQVKEAHPAVRAAQSQYEASLAKVDQTRAQGLPTISNIASYTQNDRPMSLSMGLPMNPANSRDAYIGVQVSIPIFEGFGRHYQIREAEAQAERQAGVLEETRQQVALDVWSSYQTLIESTRNTENSANLQAIAQRSWEAAKHRYDTGVGNILELMSTQATLANAKQRHIHALASWNNARVDFAAKLGWLNAMDLQ
ncbi:MAG: TolC family protein, partial [Methylobacillus sp.]|nr:TolC family protein [Methylobacillus sp.]